MLLTYDDYKKFGGTLEEKKFLALEQDAEDLINPLINFYYETNSIDDDTDYYRVRLVKKAVYLQVRYTDDIGASTPYGMTEKDIKSVSIDGTSVSTASSATDYADGGIYNLSIEYLYMSGLLFRGIPHA